MIVNSNSAPAGLWPGTKAFFDGLQKDYEYQWKKLYEVLSSNRKYEEVVSMYSPGLPTRKDESAPITYDDWSQGLTTRFTHATWALGIPLTREAIKDYKENLGNIMDMSVKKIHKSHAEFDERFHFDLINNGFNSLSIPEGGDGKPLFANDHIIKGGVSSNVLPSAEFSRQAYQNAIIQMKNIPGETITYFAGLKSTKLLVPDDIEYEVRQVMGSPYEPETANNAINPIYGRESKIEVVASQYLTSDNAWFIKTDAEEGLMHFEREPLNVQMTNDFDTTNTKIGSYHRYSADFGNWRTMLGNEGI